MPRIDSGIGLMRDITPSSGHRKQLLSREKAVCYHCGEVFLPSAIVRWCDDGQTAICPYCPVDAVVGFNGEVDPDPGIRRLRLP